MIGIRSVLILILISISITVEAVCPHSCGQNEEYSDCLSACGDGCRLLFRPVVCTFQCLPAGCKCKQDHSRDPRTNLCVLNRHCPTPDVWDYENNQPIEEGSGCGDENCGPNEEVFISNRCAEMCPDRLINVLCGTGPDFDSEGCYCSEGYCRDRSNNCVPAPSAEPICSTNEVFSVSNRCYESCNISRRHVRCMQETFLSCFCAPKYCRREQDCVPDTPRRNPLLLE